MTPRSPCSVSYTRPLCMQLGTCTPDCNLAQVKGIFSMMQAWPMQQLLSSFRPTWWMRSWQQRRLSHAQRLWHWLCIALLETTARSTLQVCRASEHHSACHLVLGGKSGAPIRLNFICIGCHLLILGIRHWDMSHACSPWSTCCGEAAVHFWLRSMMSTFLNAKSRTCHHHFKIHRILAKHILRGRPNWNVELNLRAFVGAALLLRCQPLRCKTQSRLRW